MKRTLLALSLVLLSNSLHAADFKPEIKYAEVNDVKLAYYIRGEGEPLLMINGFVSSMSLWDPLMLETLAKQHQLLRSSLPVAQKVSVMDSNTHVS